MANRANITPEVCRQLLRYDEGTGKLFWRPRPREMFASKRAFSTFNARFAGREAFTNQLATGHFQGEILGVAMYAHRVIWAILHGKWPDGVVDHWNRISSVNLPSNLRDVTTISNSRNMKMSRRNTSGFNGVGWDSRRKKWYARLGCGPTSVHLGRFDAFEDAVAARQAGNQAYGYSPQHGTKIVATDGASLEASPTGPASATVT